MKNTTKNGGRLMRLSVVIPAVVVVLLSLFASWAHAHELEVDRLSIRSHSNSQELEGQILLDPEMTRGADWLAAQQASLQVANASLLAFVQEHVVFRADERPLTVSFEVRELYAKGGAVPGDSVIYRAVLPENWRKLSVSIKDPMGPLAVSTMVDMVERPTVLMTAKSPLVVLQRAAGDAKEAAGSRNAPPPVEQSPLAASLAHVWTGVVHIIPLGWDHILFVVALTLGSFGKWRRLLLELSAFTAAHTLTLALGALEVVQVDPTIVEPLIALSISAVALEHLVDLKRKSIRYALVGVFGLIHGLGFAGALLELGLSKMSFLLFLVSFNIGVELGQLAVVGCALVALGLAARWPERRQLAMKGLAFAIATCGLVLGVVRVFG